MYLKSNYLQLFCNKLREENSLKNQELESNYTF